MVAAEPQIYPVINVCFSAPRNIKLIGALKQTLKRLITLRKGYCGIFNLELLNFSQEPVSR